MRKVLVALVLVALAAACEREAEVVFVYEVGGRGESVDVSYLGDDGFVEEQVTLPWTSDEMYTTPSRELHLEAAGAPGDNLVCGIRWRLPEARYGADGSGASTNSNDVEEAHRCELDTTAS